MTIVIISIILILGIILFAILSKKFSLKVDEKIDRYIRNAKYDKAISIIKEQLQKTLSTQEQSTLHYKLGVCYENNGNYAYSIVEYKTALLDSDTEHKKDIHLALGNTLLKLDKKEEALAQYLILLEQQVIDEELYLNIAKIYYKTANYDLSLQYLKRLEKIASKMTSKGKKTPQDEPALSEKMFHCRPRYTAH